MRTIIRHTPKLFKPEKAEEVAREMQEHDEDWKYVPRHDPKGTGWSLIDIYDEDDVLIGQV